MNRTEFIQKWGVKLDPETRRIVRADDEFSKDFYSTNADSKYFIRGFALAMALTVLCFAGFYTLGRATAVSKAPQVNPYVESKTLLQPRYKLSISEDGATIDTTYIYTNEP